jgi:hypothetical protein
MEQACIQYLFRHAELVSASPGKTFPHMEICGSLSRSQLQSQSNYTCYTYQDQVLVLFCLSKKEPKKDTRKRNCPFSGWNMDLAVVLLW